MEWIDYQGREAALIRTSGAPKAAAGELLVSIEAALTALAALHSGDLHLDGSKDPATLATITTALESVGSSLKNQIAGLTTALIRAHYAAGGTHPTLVQALDVPYSTGTTRVGVVLASQPDIWEAWATGEALAPQTYPPAALRPGWTYEDDNGKRHQVKEVRVYGDGMVEMLPGNSDRASFCFSENNPGVIAWPHDTAVVETTGNTTLPDGKTMPVTTYTRSYRSDRASA